MSGGYVLDFSDKSFKDFFNNLGVDIDNPKYFQNGSSKANRLRTYWQKAENKSVGKTIIEMAEIMEDKIRLGKVGVGDKEAKILEKEKIRHVKEIGQKLLNTAKLSTSETVANNFINIEIRPEIYKHIATLLQSEHYFNAVEEAYKVVRQRLKDITGKERATDAFSEVNQEKIFGRKPKNDAEKDFFEGVKFLHMAIQYLRNEKAHIPAYKLDKNLAIHYLSLASLAYDLISRGEE
ncbi:MAG: hypothetical protein Fur0012_10180 [Elusimicrobiota bacterium]